MPQVRRDNPRLTTRQEGGHQPVRVVMSRTLDLPQVGLHYPAGRTFTLPVHMSEAIAEAQVALAAPLWRLSPRLSLCQGV